MKSSVSPSKAPTSGRKTSHHRAPSLELQRAGLTALTSGGAADVRHCSPRLQRAMANFLVPALLNKKGSDPEDDVRYRNQNRRLRTDKHTESAPVFLPSSDENGSSSATSSYTGGGRAGGALLDRGAGAAPGKSNMRSSGSQNYRIGGGSKHLYPVPETPNMKIPSPAKRVDLDAHQKWMQYAEPPQGHFPHPTKANEKGLPFSPTKNARDHLKHPSSPYRDQPPLPDHFLKPCSNTSPILYNCFHKKDTTDVYEWQQREFNWFVEAQHKFNQEVKHLLNPNSNCRAPKNYMHATTKPLGRLYFDKHRPAFLSQEQVDKMMPPGYYRKRNGYEFWR